MNFFKWKKSMNASSVEVAEPEVSKPVTVAEIHETFLTEVDRLLVEAGIKTVVEIEDKKTFDTGKKLHELGFVATTAACEYRDTQQDILEASQENDKKELLKEHIRYFSQKYPLYRFITEESVKKICKKYGLVYGDVNFYKGDVPDKNIKEIAMAETAIKEEDVAYAQQRVRLDSSMSRGEWIWRTIRYMSQQEFSMYWDGRNRSSDDRCVRAPLVIAAPAKDFNLDMMRIENYKLVHNAPKVEDPIVLRRVIKGGHAYFLIVSAWGEEAGDPAVINQIFN